MARGSFQKSIQETSANGVAGDMATRNPVVYTVGNPLAKTPVNVGSFVWASTTQDGFAEQSGTGAPLGFVTRNLSYYTYDLTSVGTMTIPAGSPLTVARKGDFYAISTTAAAKGDKVFAVLASGSVKTGKAGTNITGSIETDWVVTDLEDDFGAAGSRITISNWS